MLKGKIPPTSAAPASVLLTTVGQLEIRANARCPYRLFLQPAKGRSFFFIGAVAPTHTREQLIPADPDASIQVVPPRYTSQSPDDGRKVAELATEMYQE